MCKCFMILISLGHIRGKKKFIIFLPPVDSLLLCTLSSVFGFRSFLLNGVTLHFTQKTNVVLCLKRRKLKPNDSDVYPNNSEETHRNSNCFCFSFAILIMYGRLIQTTTTSTIHFNMCQKTNIKPYSLRRALAMSFSVFSMLSGCSHVSSRQIQSSWLRKLT